MGRLTRSTSPSPSTSAHAAARVVCVLLTTAPLAALKTPVPSLIHSSLAAALPSTAPKKRPPETFVPPLPTNCKQSDGVTQGTRCGRTG